MKISKRHTKFLETLRGFTVVEMILYITMLTLLTSSLVVTAISLLGTFSQMGGREDIAQAGVVSLERITRELRFANEVNVGASTLGTSPGVLVLNTVDAGGSPTTVTISQSGNRIMFSEGGGAAAPLTHNRVTVSGLTFTHVDGVQTEAVSVSFTASTTVRGTDIAKSYRAFVVLDAS